MVVGSVELSPVLDAVGVLAPYAEAYPDVPVDDWDLCRAPYPDLFAGHGSRLPDATYVLRSGDTAVPFDTGLVPPGLWDFWTPEREGLLPAALERIGAERERVDVVFLTHLHIDHIGWNTDEAGAIMFPNAHHVVHLDALTYALTNSNRPHLRRCVWEEAA